MSKGWETLETINSANYNEKTKTWERHAHTVIPQHKTDVLLKNAKRLTIKELKKESEKEYELKMAYEDQLIKAYKEKKIISKRLMKEARTILKTRQAEAKAAENKKKSQKTTEDKGEIK